MTRKDVVDGRRREAPPRPSESYPLEKPSFWKPFWSFWKPSGSYAASLSASVPTDPTE